VATGAVHLFTGADSMTNREAALAAALCELTAIVRGECPQLLDEDSGGNSRLSIVIDLLLAEEPAEPEVMK